MADSLGTAGAVVSSISPALSAIPYVGGILSAAGTVAGGLMQQAAAKKQAAQAAKIRQDALNTQKQGLRPEFLAKKRMDEMGYLSGLPGYNLAKENIDEDAASNLRAIRDGSPNGTATAAAVAAGLELGNKANRELDIKNAEYKAGKLNDVGTTEWAIGEKQRDLENIRDMQRKEGLTAASAMENASTANKMNAANTITGALTSTVASLGKTAQNQQYMKLLSSVYANGGTMATKNDPITGATITPNGGDSMMTNNQTLSFGDNQQKLSDILSGTTPFADEHIPFLADMYNGLAVSGKPEDAATAQQIQQLLQANR